MCGTRSCCDPIFSNLALSYPSSMSIYKINSQMTKFIELWRANYHRPNINFGLSSQYYAGWIRKVVRCADIPEYLVNLGHIASSNTIPSGWNESEIGFAVRRWRSLESLLTTDNLTASFSSPPDYPAGPIVAPVKPSLSVTVKNGYAHVMMTGDAAKWFAIGFGAQKMSDHPDTLVMYANGKIEERKLSQYSPGAILKSEFTILSNTVVDKKRSVTLMRNATASSPVRFTFPPAGANLQYIWASGMQTTQLMSHVWSGNGNIIVSAWDTSFINEKYMCMDIGN